MLRRYGCSEIWINRVMGIIRSVSYTFLHNGVEFGRVEPKRGLRQGYPISPYIYILCAEGSSAIVRRNEEAGLLHGCIIAKGAPMISHLLFADDCYLFFRANEIEAGIMKRILTWYENISGQVINYNKSVVTFSPNTSEASKLAVCSELGVASVSAHGKYLGLPMTTGRSKRCMFNFLQDKVKQKLQGWTTQILSKAGKMMLLKSAAQVIPNFWMNLFLIPGEVCDQIEKQMNSFWWSSGGTGKGIKWMTWSRMCTVNEDGGLGFKNLRAFNLAMLAKQGWRLLNSTNPLVTALMKARYYPDTDFLNARIGANPSFMWRSIMAAQATVRQGCRRHIGDGLSTKI